MINKWGWMFVVVFGIVIAVGILIISVNGCTDQQDEPGPIAVRDPDSWTAPDIDSLKTGPDADLIRYGKDLIARTSYYLGPKGKVAAITNGMNCQNCHLDAGTREWGNNYSGVYSTYPKFRARSGSIESIYKRVNDCIERSLNGKQILDTNSREMQAFYAYIKWLGENVPRETRPRGSGIRDLEFPAEAADPENGNFVYTQNCLRCHGQYGQGVADTLTNGYTYPPLWGEHSFTTAAGLFRLSRFAGFVKYNMPYDAPYKAPMLTDQEAWDVAAFINSQPRPQKDFKQDWPDISKKPFDHPYGPYADGFSEKQHKYGPFGPIVKANNQ